MLPGSLQTSIYPPLICSCPQYSLAELPSHMGQGSAHTLALPVLAPTRLLLC